MWGQQEKHADHFRLIEETTSKAQLQLTTNQPRVTQLPRAPTPPPAHPPSPRDVNSAGRTRTSDDDHRQRPSHAPKEPSNARYQSTRSRTFTAKNHSSYNHTKTTERIYPQPQRQYTEKEKRRHESRVGVTMQKKPSRFTTSCGLKYRPDPRSFSTEGAKEIRNLQYRSPLGCEYDEGDRRRYR
jgi:hypothetical protein